MSGEFQKFVTIGESASRSKERRRLESESLIPFGVSFLDECFNGIGKSELIVLSGRTGGGKTEMISHIAQQAARIGKKVYLFALEAESDEIGLRIQYKKLCQSYFEDRFRKTTSKPISFDDWMISRLDDIFEPYYDDVVRQMSGEENLFVRYATEDYGLENFEADVISTKHNADLLILDHLHYLDLDDEESNAAYKGAVKKIRNLALIYQKPIILVAHIRKSDRRIQSLIPDQDDIHGSSDIIKIATKAIMIAPANEYVDAVSNHNYPTFVKAIKYRRNGAKTFQLAAINFNNQLNDYEKAYILGRAKTEKGKLKFEALEDDKIPSWAKSAQKRGY